MPVVREPTPFTMHGSTFESYVRPPAGSSGLCAWRLTVEPGGDAVPHRPSREEVLLVLTGSLRVTIDGATAAAFPGDAVHVPAGAELAVASGPEGATAWVTTTSGLRATTSDGAEIAPPWAN